MDEDPGINGADVRFVASLLGPLKGSLLFESIDLKSEPVKSCESGRKRSGE